MPFLVSVLLFKCLSRLTSGLAAKFCFLQRNAQVLALKNLKAYSLFMYFKFFYDCFAGLAFCVVRMLTQTLVSIVFLPRLDYSFMGRSLEKMDTAFMSYVGYLHWESHHTNPIAICFCELLQRSLKLNAKLKMLNIVSNEARVRVRNRWYLYYMLSKNRQLIQLRRRAKI